jgi:hypothetical protein
MESSALSFCAGKMSGMFLSILPGAAQQAVNMQEDEMDILVACTIASILYTIPYNGS